jgi:hypothetical protein
MGEISAQTRILRLQPGDRIKSPKALCALASRVRGIGHGDFTRRTIRTSAGRRQGRAGRGSNPPGLEAITWTCPPWAVAAAAPLGIWLHKLPGSNWRPRLRVLRRPLRISRESPLLSWQVAQGDFGKTRPTDNNEAEKNQPCGSQSYSMVLRRFSLDPSLGTQATRALV